MSKTNTEENLDVENVVEAVKASLGDVSEIPDAVSKSDNSRPADNNNGEKTPVAQGSSKLTKTGMITDLMTKMHTMTKKDLSVAHASIMSGKGEGIILQGNSKLTKEDIDVSEDIKALFNGDEDLSEEFKEKATLIFETAILTKINERIEELSESNETVLTEETLELKEELEDRLDSYLDYVVEQWMEDNRLAVESGLRAEIAEDFMAGLKTLFTEHHIDIPDEKSDILEELTLQVEEAELALNKELTENIRLNESIANLNKEIILNTVSSDLTMAHSEKLRGFAANIEYVTEEDFKTKLEMIKENYFDEDSKLEHILGDEWDEILTEEVKTTVPGSMTNYVSAISRTVKR
jgi:hypothetical protein